MDARYVIFIDEAAHPCRRFFVDAAAHLLVALASVRGLSGNPRRVFSQDFAQLVSYFFDILSRLFQLVGIQIHILHADGGCKYIHVAVIDVAALGGDGGGAGLVAQRLSGIVIVFDHHESVKLRRNGHKGKNSQHRHDQHDSVVLSGIRPQTAVLSFPPDILSHIPPAFPQESAEASSLKAVNGQQGVSLTAHCSSILILLAAACFMQTGPSGTRKYSPTRVPPAPAPESRA